MSSNNLFNIPQFKLGSMFDKYASMSVFFTMIVIFQGCFGGLGVQQTPKKLSDLVQNPVMRILFVTAIGYTATSDIETALFTAFLFFLMLHLLRTKEEKESMIGYV